MPSSKHINIEGVRFGTEAMPLIAGPCVIESRDHALKMASAIAAIARQLDLPYIFKSSFDKANRTALDSFRGPGLEEGLVILAEVKDTVGVPVLTDVHLPEQVTAVAEVADVLQIPAFLCRQTDLVLAVGRAGKVVNVKKGQFLAPYKMEHVVAKIESTDNHRILLTDRGTTFGYQDMVSDMRSILIMQRTGYPVIFDATHSAQIPGSGAGETGGSREFIPALARSAVAVGCDGIFMEVHDNPSQAKSDAATQWPLDQLTPLLTDLIRIREVVVNRVR